ncbi:MAG: hypothetical protein FWG57_05245 [Endomicrobia bacterium]|nr:hypothetical protein [Endomicrobiia bacterium]
MSDAKSLSTLISEIANILGLIIIPVFIWVITWYYGSRKEEKRKRETEISLLRTLAIDIEMALQVMIAVHRNQVSEYLKVLSEIDLSKSVHGVGRIESYIVCEINLFSSMEKLSFLNEYKDEAFPKAIFQFYSQVNSINKRVVQLNEATKNSFAQIMHIFNSADIKMVHDEYIKVQTKNIADLKKLMNDCILFVSDELIREFSNFENKYFKNEVNGIKALQEDIAYITTMKEERKSKNG